MGVGHEKAPLIYGLSKEGRCQMSFPHPPTPSRQGREVQESRLQTSRAVMASTLAHCTISLTTA